MRTHARVYRDIDVGTAPFCWNGWMCKRVAPEQFGATQYSLMTHVHICACVHVYVALRVAEVFSVFFFCVMLRLNIVFFYAVNTLIIYMYCGHAFCSHDGCAHVCGIEDMPDVCMCFLFCMPHLLSASRAYSATCRLLDWLHVYIYICMTSTRRCAAPRHYSQRRAMT